MSEFLYSIFHIPKVLRYIWAVIKKCIQSVRGNHPLIAWNDFKNRKLVKINLPFLLKLPGKASKKAKVISYSNTCYQLLVFWDVSIIELNSVLYRPWEDISNAIKRGTLLHGFCAHQGPIIRYPSHNDKVIKITRPPAPVGLGPPSSDRYPLVIFQVRDLVAKVKAKEYVALITMINRADENTKAIAIQAQYFKQANGEVICLQNMYLSPCGPVDAISTENSKQSHLSQQNHISIARFELLERVIEKLKHQNLHQQGHASKSIERLIAKLEQLNLSQEIMVTPQGSDSTLGPHIPDLPYDGPFEGHSAAVELSSYICVVCKHAPISYGLQPCNHACLCKSCFFLSMACPLCRGPMESYFYYDYQLRPGSYIIKTNTVFQKVWGFLRALHGDEKSIDHQSISHYPYILHCESQI